jgi:stage III sporulation protein AH
LGDITDLSSAEEASSEGVLGVLNASFANFKLNKEKSNMDVLDYLEESLSSSLISDETKEQFEQLLLKKNSFIEAEQGIELMLQSKGYNESVAIVDESMVKIVTNDTIEKADATVILDVVVSETNYTPSQIKIVKFDNIDL